MHARDGRNPRPAMLCGGLMIRISLAYVGTFTTQIEAVRSIKVGEKVSDHWFTLLIAHSAIDNFINKSVFAAEIRTSRQSATDFSNLLNQYTTVDQVNAGHTFDQGQISSLEYYLNQFKTILWAELETLNAHFVTQKRGYDSAALISYAEAIFPPDLAVKAPDAIPDIREAGKCIAFELPTAAGFHLHRANEAVLHRYYDHVSGGLARPKNRNIGGYLTALTQSGFGDQRLLATLRDLNELHRNPLIHPDQSLETIDDAIALMNAVHNAVVFMLKAIPSPPAIEPT